MTIAVSAPTPGLRRKAGARPLIALVAAATMLVGLQSPAQAQATICDGSLQGFFGCMAINLGLISFDNPDLERMLAEADRALDHSARGNSRFETGQSIAGGAAAQTSTDDPVEMCWGGSYIPRSQCPPHP